uniref:zinc finger BED domain-containing protein 4-like isoform X3 n=1 Tax=Myxine glutinosa TaxID=7769 RepID=UPI00358F7D7E
MQLAGDTVTESIMCEKARDIYGDLVQQTAGTSKRKRQKLSPPPPPASSSDLQEKSRTNFRMFSWTKNVHTFTQRYLQQDQRSHRAKSKDGEQKCLLDQVYMNTQTVTSPDMCSWCINTSGQNSIHQSGNNVKMERFLTLQPSGSARDRHTSDANQQSQHSDIHNPAVNMMGDVEDSQEICALTPQLARSESRMSLDSIESAEINVTMDTDNSSLSQKWRHIAPFFKVVDSKATCTKCSKTLKAQPGSSSNLKVHYQRYHDAQHNDLKAALDGGSRRGRHKSFQDMAGARRQASIEETFKEKFSQKKCLDLYYRSFIGCMKPASETDNEHNRALWAYACPQFKVPSRRKLTRDIRAMGDQAKADLTDLLAKQEFVATTADSWSASNRAFLGMTVTWLERVTFERQSAVLGIKEITVSQTGQYLAEAISELHDDFGIKRKVVSTTTDNGANYISALNHYGALGRDDEQLDVVEVDPEVVQTNTILVVDALEEVDQQEEVVHVPKHRRCAAHTVNLLASRDVEKVPGWSAQPRPAFTKPAAKAQGLWNAQNRKTVIANDIKTALGKKLVTPGVTRWNSSHDAYKCLLTEVLDMDKRNNLNQICQRQHPHPLPHITEDDVQIWSEYVKVTAPLAACLDVLQGEEKAYMGCLLPHLQVLKDSLEALSIDGSIVHAQNLVASLLQQPSCARKGTKGFDGRFSHLFVDMDLLMATALHPQHKLATVRAICRRQNNDAICDLVRDKLIRDLLALVLPDEHLDPAPQQGPQPGSSSTDYLFAMEEGQQEENLEEKIREEVNNWSRKPLRGNPGLSPNLFPLEFRDAWVTLFLRHNTPLPSSASVERVFSYGSDILRPKRSALAAPNFEALVFMKGNLQILKKAHEVEEEDED